MPDIEAVLKKLKPSLPETIVELYLNGALYAQWREADQELRRRRQEGHGNSLAGDAEARKLAQRVTDIEEELRSSRAVVRLRSLGRAWTGHVLKHPPRDGNETDGSIGANVDTLFPEVLPLSIVELTTADGETVQMLTERDGERVQTAPELYEAITENVSDAQWSELCSNVLAVNTGSLGVPFSLAASQISQSSGGDSNSPNDSASATSGSKGGSRKKSSNTSTTKKGE